MSDLPRELPGARESDASLGLDALDLIRKQIADHVEATQGAWARSPLWRRSWPLALGLVCAAAYAGYIARSAGGAAGLAAAIAWLSSVGAFVAVGRAPLHPAWAERAARVSLAGGALALASEIGLTYFAPLAAPDASNMVCARIVVVGAVVPCALLAWYVRSSGVPARLFHIAALAGAAFLASSAAVWAACPSTAPSHVLIAHAGTPVLAAVVVALIVRPLLRGTSPRS